jgi:hypothetical protein
MPGPSYVISEADNSVISNLTKSINLFEQNAVESDIFVCPMLITILHNKISIAHQALKTRTITKKQITNMIDSYKLITTDGKIHLSEIENNIKKFNDLFDEKKEQAILENKKLLIVMGEAHDHQESFFYQFIISMILKNKGFHSVLVEHSEYSLKDYMKDFKNIKTNFNLKIFKFAVDMELFPIDPYHLNSVTDSKRNGAINKAVASNSDKDQMLVVGANHVKHIMNSIEIKTKFIILPILSVVPLSKHLKIGSKASFGDEFPTENVINIQFNDLIESFSIQELFNIIKNSLPSILNAEPFSENVIYSSNFSEHKHAKCEMFNVIPQWIKGLTEDFVTLTGTHIDMSEL